MIRSNFKQWAESMIQSLNDDLISTEFVTYKTDESLIPNPSTGVIHESEQCLGQVTVWESCQMEYEIVNIVSEEMIIWRYIERISDDTDFNDILKEYFHVLNTGLKP